MVAGHAAARWVSARDGQGRSGHPRRHRSVELTSSHVPWVFYFMNTRDPLRTDLPDRPSTRHEARGRPLSAPTRPLTLSCISSPSPLDPSRVPLHSTLEPIIATRRRQQTYQSEPSPKRPSDPPSHQPRPLMGAISSPTLSRLLSRSRAPFVRPFALIRSITFSL